jgi:mevalonate kinase
MRFLMMNKPTISASAPGSLMLLGEHAVLHGRRAMVCAIDRRITVSLTPRADRQVQIESALGAYISSLDELADHADFRFVLDAIRGWSDFLVCGFDLQIDSGFSADIGFGSSAAVTVATHAVLMQLAGERFCRKSLFRKSLQTVHAVQGRGSGADLAAAVYGGVVAYRAEPLEIKPVPVSHPLTASYCGYKRKTAEVIELLEEARAQDDKDYFARIFDSMDQSVEEALPMLEAQDWAGFGHILNMNQALMDALGLNTPELAEIVSALQRDPKVCGAKISGSGLGDCAIGWGAAQLDAAFKYPVYALNISPEGVVLEVGE